jgi:hypothetical protein
MAHIFISYARTDAGAANRLVGTLAKAGYEAWIDREIPGGDLWKRRIVEAIDGADAFLILLSPNSVASDNVRRELDVADARKKLILPLVIAPMKTPQEMEYSLAGLQTIDFAADADAADRQLLNALRSLRAIEEKSVGWKTKEALERLNAILPDPARSIREKTHDYIDVASTPSEGLKTWQKKSAEVQARRDANTAEREELRKKQEKLLQEAGATSSAEIKKQKLEKCNAITRQLESLTSESTAISKDELAVMGEAAWERTKNMDQNRKMLEEAYKLSKGIWK